MAIKNRYLLESGFTLQKNSLEHTFNSHPLLYYLSPHWILPRPRNCMSAVGEHTARHSFIIQLVKNFSSYADPRPISLIPLGEHKARHSFISQFVKKFF
jgi:hypothetical protein